jgi:hypothetical protein
MAGFLVVVVAVADTHHVAVTAQFALFGPAQLAPSRPLTLVHHKEKSCW